MGQTITVPLYFTDSSNNPVNLLGAGSTFQLRLRTPCSNLDWQFCPKTGGSVARFVIDTSNGDKKFKFMTFYLDPVVSWQISGEDYNKPDTYTLGPFLDFKTSSGYSAKSSAIDKGLVNTAYNSGLPVLSATATSGFGVDIFGCRGYINDFLTNNSSTHTIFDCNSTTKWWQNTDQKIKKPVFKFTVIHSLTATSSGGNIPYLEYQILMKDLAQPAYAPTNAYQTITGESVSGSYKQVLEVKMPQESGILEYVIQQ